MADARRRSTFSGSWAVFALLVILAAPVASEAARPQTAISNVRISRPFFNPTLGQTVGISFEVSRSGVYSLLILDRDGYPVRRLAAGVPVEIGEARRDWDGRDDAGRIVPDEAYSLEIELEGKDGRSTYLPGNSPPEDLSVSANYYDRRGGVLSYTLPRAARLHIQAGTVRTDPKTRAASGPVLKTLVNREPRPAGPVVETWNGFDEGGTFHVPSLPHFVLAIAATTLPENSILTSGNRDSGLPQLIANRSGASHFTFSTEGHRHHRGLEALEDVSPRLAVQPLEARWSSRERAWEVRGKTLRVRTGLSGPSSESFSRQPGSLQVFVDERRVATLPAHPKLVSVDVPLPVDSGRHIVALNWASAYGPVAANAFAIVSAHPHQLARAADGGTK